MILVLGVSLYTSRIILQHLGIEDFGIFNLIAGVVVMFTFLNNAMNSTIQRFFNVELAKNENGTLSKLFSASLQIQFLLIILFLVLAESIGLWFLNYKLNIPASRIKAANYVYQFTLLITVLNFLKIPFNAMIIAYERMRFFAILSVIEVVLKLALVFSLSYFGADKLIMYAVLLSFLAGLILLFNYKYAKRNFNEDVLFYFQKDKNLWREMASFSGWSLFGNVALLSSNQGVAIVLNLFLGVFINATMGIANQINAALFTFISNLQIAFKPQAIQSYASGNIQAHINFLFQTSKVSYFLLLVLVLPLLMNMEQVLNIWLGVVPEYAIEFSKLILVFALVDALAGPFWMSANAIGNIKNYQIVIGVILLLNLPFAYLILYLGYSPVYVMLVKVVLNFLGYIYRIKYVLNKTGVLPKKHNLYYGTIMIISIIACLLYILKNQYFTQNSDYAVLVFSSAASVLVLSTAIWFFGFTKTEKNSLITLGKKLINR